MWSDESPFTPLPTSGRVYVWRTPKKAYNSECLVPTVKYGRRCSDGLGSNIVALYSVGSVITLHGRITTKEYVDKLGCQEHPMIQTLSPNNDAVSQDDNAPIHTAGTVQSWFEKHEGELQHLPWLAESPDLNIIEPL
jgi:hypothetical protein